MIGLNVPLRPGLAAAERRKSLLMNIDIYREELTSRGGACRITLQEIAAWEKEVEECDAIMAVASPDELHLQKIDHLIAAEQLFNKAKDNFFDYIVETIEPLMGSRRAEAERIINLIPDNFNDLRGHCMNHLNGLRDERYAEALARYARWDAEPEVKWRAK